MIEIEKSASPAGRAQRSGLLDHHTRLVRSAPFRLTALYVAAFSISVLLLGAIVFWITDGAMVRQFKGRIEVEAAALLAEYRAEGIGQLAKAIEEREQSKPWREFRYRLASTDGTRVVGTLDGEPNPRPGWSTRRGPSHKSDLAVLTMPVGDAHLLSIAGSPSSIREVEGALLETFGWVLAATLLIGLAGGAFLSSRFLDRVDGIAGAVRAIIAGDYRERMPIRGTEDELDRLAETLNVMLDRIGGLMDSLRQVSNDIAHDLRTPLSRLRQRLELALATTRSEEKLREAVTEAIADTDDILATFSALLRIAQIEAGTRKAGFASVDLSQVVSDVAQAYAPTIEDEGKRLHVAVEPDLAQTGDRELLTQLVANLIENAMRHTPEGTDITVSLTSQPTGAMLVVADNGPGVPPEAFDQLFRRFYRLECSRTTPGSGLGLSLVKAICDLHSATATLRDNAPGLRVEVVLPDLRRRRA